MERRRRILIAASALPWLGLPRFGFAQARERPIRVGIIAFGTTQDNGHLRQTLLDELGRRGFVEGRNLVFEPRYAEGSLERVPEIASELASLGLDVVVTTCTPTTRFMRNATQTVPLVMAGAADPVGQGLIASYARPGGNITGIASQFEDLAAKMLHLLIEAVPTASPVAVVFNPRNPVHKRFLTEVNSAAQTLGARAVPVEIARASDIEEKLQARSPPGAASLMILPDDPSLMHLRWRFLELAGKQRLPTMFGINEAAEDGALMSYGQTLANAYARAAYFVDRIAKGAKPADLPVERPTQFELVVNLKTAKALGIRIPQSVLLRAGRVIE